MSRGRKGPRQREILYEVVTGNIVNETVIPKKPNYGEQLGVEFLKGMMANPASMSTSIEGLSALMEMAEKMPKKDNNENK